MPVTKKERKEIKKAIPKGKTYTDIADASEGVVSLSAVKKFFATGEGSIEVQDEIAKAITQLKRKNKQVPISKRLKKLIAA